MGMVCLFAALPRRYSYLRVSFWDYHTQMDTAVPNEPLGFGRLKKPMVQRMAKQANIKHVSAAMYAYMRVVLHRYLKDHAMSWKERHSAAGSVSSLGPSNAGVGGEGAEGAEGDVTNVTNDAAVVDATSDAHDASDAGDGGDGGDGGGEGAEGANDTDAEEGEDGPVAGGRRFIIPQKTFAFLVRKAVDAKLKWLPEELDLFHHHVEAWWLELFRRSQKLADHREHSVVQVKDVDLVMELASALPSVERE